MPDEPPDPQVARNAARDALARGDALTAYDLASAAAAAGDDLEARHLEALALARCGATERAREAAERLLADIGDGDVAARLREDVEALVARLLKDRALQASGAERRRLAAAAAARYEATARRLRRHFSSVNAATMWRLAGDDRRSRELARLALQLADGNDDEPDSTYWRAATRAEAALLLDDPDEARRAVDAAASEKVGLGLRATTRRQLSVVCASVGADLRLLDPLAVPSVVHFCGHRADGAVDGRFPPVAERRVRALVDEWLGSHDVGLAFGSLASGADIVLAERLAERNVELHVVLPFAAEEFEAVSVRPGGPSWVPRFRALLDRAASVVTTCDSAFLGDAELFALAGRVAMGRALTRARALGTTALQLAVWDRQPAAGVGGTGDDVAAWQRAGGDTVVFDIDPPDPARRPPTAAPAPRVAGRAVRAIVFTDLRGFARLYDEQYVSCIEGVLRPLSDALAPFRDRILFHKTWGDGMQLVLTDVAVAGAAALAMQRVAASIDLASLGLPPDLTLRIGAHAGAVLEHPDPFVDAGAHWGREMTRAARIEPRTPPGEIYVTETFAALAAVDSAADFACEYVGRVTTAKDFETIPMYRLRPAVTAMA
jgi:hypothetical protein